MMKGHNYVAIKLKMKTDTNVISSPLNTKMNGHGNRKRK